VGRGGGWGSSAVNLRSASRNSVSRPDYRSLNFGFRLVRP